MTVCKNEFYSLPFNRTHQYDHLQETEFSTDEILNSENKKMGRNWRESRCSLEANNNQTTVPSSGNYTASYM